MTAGAADSSPRAAVFLEAPHDAGEHVQKILGDQSWSEGRRRGAVYPGGGARRVEDGRPVVIPTAHWRDGDRLYLPAYLRHGRA